MPIAATLAALYPERPVLELRILFSDAPRVDSGYFNDYTKLERVALNYNGTSQIYYSINPCNPDLIARASNRVKERAKQTTTDRDITRRSYLPIDLDPVRPAGISASDKEHRLALTRAQTIKKYLTEQGWPLPIELDSGNGAYLEYAIDLPNDDQSTELLKSVLAALDMLFSDAAIKVDTTMYNAARIVRLFETKNTKGDSTAERPHRLAQIIERPEAPALVDRKLLEALAAMLPQAPTPANVAPKLDFELWLAQNELTIAKRERWANKATMYTLAQCVFNAEHKDAAIFVFDNGGYDYKCFHDSCAAKKWKDFKKIFPMPDDSKAKSAKILQQLNGLGYYFKLNLCADRIEVNGAPITDALSHKIAVQMFDKGVKPQSIIESVISAAALDNAYHPVKDYLLSVAYDPERDYINELASYLYDLHPKIEDDTTAYVWLKHWLIGNVAKIFEQEQNPMLTLAGAQWIGKSTFARYLASGLPTFFIESSVQPDRADDKLRLIQSWIWEVAELEATTRKADVAALKAFITTQYVTVRRPYGRYDMHKPAMASFIGTVNDDGAGFLVDTTGNRRFLVLSLSKIDYGYRAIPIDRVWSQAVALFKSGYDWRLKEDEKAHQREINKQFETLDPYVDVMRSALYIDPEDVSSWLSSFQILEIVRQRIDLRGDLKRQTMDLSKAARSLGLKKERRSDVYGYVGVRPKEAITITFAKKVESPNQ